jgi:hypothetical protein
MFEGYPTLILLIAAVILVGAISAEIVRVITTESIRDTDYAVLGVVLLISLIGIVILSTVV